MRRAKARNGVGTVAAMALAAAVLLGLAGAWPAPAGQDEQFTPEYRQMHNTFDAKHTPRFVVAPERVKRGEWFDVTVSIGAGGDHPSLTEHHVRYVALYVNTVEIARAYLHPVYSLPRVTFTIALDEGGELRAVAEPTHSAAWEASKKITVVP